MTAQTTTTPVAEQILAQIDNAQTDQVLDDAAIWQLPFLLVAVRSTGEAELVERHTTEGDAAEALATFAQHTGEVFDEVYVTNLNDIGYPPVASNVTRIYDVGDGSLEHVDEQGQPTLIDRSAYEDEALALPKIDGNQIDRIAISFSGQVFLDRSDPQHVAIYRDLVLGKGNLALKVYGKCSGTGAKLATDKGGELDVVVGNKTLRVEAIDIPAGA